MAGSTMTIRKDSNGRIRSITATGKYARDLFNSLQPVTIAVKPKPTEAPAK